MKNTDVRIGNLIYNRTSKEIENVFNIDEEGINGVVNPNDGNEVSYSEIESLHLTKNVLLDLLFECRNDISCLYLLKINGISIYVNLLNVGKNPQWKVEIKHKYNPYKIIEKAHELQNFIHSETGINLIIEHQLSL